MEESNGEKVYEKCKRKPINIRLGKKENREATERKVSCDELYGTKI